MGIAVRIGLIGVVIRWAVIAGVARAVAIGIFLPWISNGGAVVICVWDVITVGICQVAVFSCPARITDTGILRNTVSLPTTYIWGIMI